MMAVISTSDSGGLPPYFQLFSEVAIPPTPKAVPLDPCIIKTTCLLAVVTTNTETFCKEEMKGRKTMHRFLWRPARRKKTRLDLITVSGHVVCCALLLKRKV